MVSWDGKNLASLDYANKKKTAMRGSLPSARLALVALLVSFGGSFHFGYQLTITNPSQAAFISFVNHSYSSHYEKELDEDCLEAIWSAIVAVLFVGAILGSLTLRWVADKIGRRRGLMLAYALSTVSVSLSILSFFVVSFELYALSRATLGIALSWSLGLAALFLTESSPKQCRGIVSMTTGLIVQLGTVVGSVAGMPQIFGTTDHWWIIYAVEVVILVAVLIVLPITHESPGYLLLHGDEEAARKSILFYYSCPVHDAEDHLAEIKDNIRQSTNSVGMVEVWKNPIYRRGTIVGCMVAFAMAFSGIAVINAFAVEILRETGLTVVQASLANVGLSLISLIATTLSSLVVDKFGRRPLLLITNLAILVLNVLIFAFMLAFDKHQYDWLGICLIVTIALFIVAFATGPGPLCYFITAELLGQNARSAGQSWASLVQMTSRSVLLAIFLPMGNAIGQAWSYLALFVAPILFALVFFYYNLPETKNKNLLEVEDEIANLPRFSCCRTVRVVDVPNEERSVSTATQISTISQ